MGAQQFGQGEDVLAVRHWVQNLILNPLAVCHHALLMATRTEIARLTGKCEQVLVPAFIAVDACEALVQITTVDEAIQHFALDAAIECAPAPGWKPGYIAF